MNANLKKKKIPSLHINCILRHIPTTVENEIYFWSKTQSSESSKTTCANETNPIQADSSVFIIIIIIIKIKIIIIK